MNIMQSQVREFHRAFGLPVSSKPGFPSQARCNLRVELIREEFSELSAAIAARDLTAVADALGDLLYVVFGAALEFGIDLEPVVSAIHVSNMSKLGNDGKPLYRADGKVLKGPGYRPPDIVGALAGQNLRICVATGEVNHGPCEGELPDVQERALDRRSEVQA